MVWERIGESKRNCQGSKDFEAAGNFSGFLAPLCSQKFSFGFKFYSKLTAV